MANPPTTPASPRAALSLEALAEAKQKQVGNILAKLDKGKVAGHREMKLLEQVVDTPGAPGSQPLVNGKQERFCQALALGGATAVSAYADAGYKPNRSHASRLAARPEIVERVAFLRDSHKSSVRAVTPPLLPSPATRVRARENGGPASPGMIRTMESVSLTFAAAFDAAFPDDVIIAHLQRQLVAERSFMQDGVVVTAPDHTTQLKAISEVLDRKLGVPFKAIEPKASKSVDLSEFTDRIRKSPAYRQGLRELLEEAEAEAAKEAAAAKEAGP